MKKPDNILIIGDILAIAIVTIIGFATHGELATSFIIRVAAAFFPMTLAWFLLAPWFGLFDSSIISNPRQLWRPALAMIFAAPVAVVIRGLVLNAAIPPIFALVLGSTSAFAMVVWRVVYFWFRNRTK